MKYDIFISVEKSMTHLMVYNLIFISTVQSLNLYPLLFKVKDLTPQVINAARVVFANPDNVAAVEHFDLLKKQWSDNMDKLRGLMDEAVDSRALINAQGTVDVKSFLQ